MNIHRITYNPKTKSSSLYFIGCNFRCLCCYWKEIYGQVNFKKLKFPSFDEVLSMLKQVSPKSISILSGDPRPNPEFNRLPKALKDTLGCQVRLLTNGYILPELEGVTHVSMSIKAVSDELHQSYTGRSNKACLEHFKTVHDKGIELSASSVYIPGLIEAIEIETIAKFIANIDDNIPLRVIGYMKVKTFDYRVPSKEKVEGVATIARKYLKNVVASRSSGEDYSGVVDLFTNDLRK